MKVTQTNAQPSFRGNVRWNNKEQIPEIINGMNHLKKTLTDETPNDWDFQIELSSTVNSELGTSAKSQILHQVNDKNGTEYKGDASINVKVTAAKKNSQLSLTKEYVIGDVHHKDNDGGVNLGSYVLIKKPSIEVKSSKLTSPDKIKEYFQKLTANIVYDTNKPDSEFVKALYGSNAHNIFNQLI